MCMKVDCTRCEKPTWKGCGKHIEQALKDVPEDERCQCPRDVPIANDIVESKPNEAETITTTTTTAAAIATEIKNEDNKD
jgi:hypothetical protein